MLIACLGCPSAPGADPGHVACRAPTFTLQAKVERRQKGGDTSAGCRSDEGGPAAGVGQAIRVLF
jgi:hypothetical protein